jgi:3',5'-cyclic AMP phosphodiesterase CpdA
MAGGYRMYASIARAMLFAVCLVVLGAGFCAAAETAGLRLPIRFAVIGDRTGGHEAGIHGEVLKEIEGLKPDFVIGVGDMIEGYTSDRSAIEREWKEYDALLESLSMPFYRVPGNHDIWDDTSAEIYRSDVAEPYYSFNAGPVHFIILDTSRWPTVGSFPQQQIDWLLADLVESRSAEYTVVLTHRPYWIETVARGKPDPLHTILVDHGVDAVFTGHYHVYFSGRYDGILYTGVGSSGGDCAPGLTGLKYHFVWVTADETGISIAPIKMGSVVPWNEVTAAEFNLVEDIKREAVRIDPVRVGTHTSVERADVAVTVKNFSVDSTLVGALQWEAEGIWSIRPKRVPVQIASGKSHRVVFEGRSEDGLYPVPSVTMAYTYGPGRGLDVEVAVPLVRTAYARRAETPPEIDGHLDEAFWVEPVRDLYTGEGFTDKTDSTSFYFGWDAGDLYIGAVCLEKEMGSLAASVTEHDGPVYAEDCLGFFLQPEVPGGPVYQIYFNPQGSSFDQRITIDDGRATDVDPGWNGAYDVAVTKQPHRWILEAAIPLDQLATTGQYEKTWSVNFRRKQKRLETSADWQVPVTYDPVTYGYLVMQ